MQAKDWIYPVLQIKFPEATGDIECGMVWRVNTVMVDCLGDAGALLAARLERLSLDDIPCQPQPNFLHSQHGAHHHG